MQFSLTFSWVIVRWICYRESRCPRFSCWVTYHFPSLQYTPVSSCSPQDFLSAAQMFSSSCGFLLLLESEWPDKEGMLIWMSWLFKVSSRKGQEPRGLGGTSWLTDKYRWKCFGSSSSHRGHTHKQAPFRLGLCGNEGKDQLQLWPGSLHGKVGASWPRSHLMISHDYF